MQIRVGLHSGEVVVRSVGSDLRMDYTAVGQTTHLAARMDLRTATTMYRDMDRGFWREQGEREVRDA